jgi:hypothetical protein
VSIYHNGQSVATHATTGYRKYNTVKEHMCSSHRHYIENQDMITLRNWAFAIDEVVLEVVDQFYSEMIIRYRALILSGYFCFRT